MTGQANCSLKLQIDIIQMEEKKWKTLSSEYLIRRPWLTARRDKVDVELLGQQSLDKYDDPRYLHKAQR